MTTSTANRTRVLVDFALQGGGAHGAFTWSVLESRGQALMGDPRAGRRERGKSRYDLSPGGANPLRNILAETVDFDRLYIRRGSLIDLRRLFVIVPPGLGDAARVARFGRGPAEHVPIGEPVRGLVPVRKPI